MNIRFIKVIYGTVLMLLELGVLLALYLIFATLTKQDYSKIFEFNRMYFNFALPGMLLFIAYFLRNLYSFKTYLIWEEVKAVISSALVVMTIFYIMYIFKDNIDTYEALFLLTFVVFIPLDIVLRYFYRIVLFNTGLLRTNVIIIGAGYQGIELSRIIKNDKFTTYNVVGFIDGERKEIDGNKVLGRMSDVDHIIKKHKIHEVIIGIPAVNRKQLSEVIGHLEGKVRRIKFIPDMYGLMTFSTEIVDFERVLTITSAQGLINPINKIYKRIFDIFGAIIGLMILLPLTVLSYIMIKIEDNGPVFFKQDRLGLNGKKIKIWKFRTMLMNAEAILEDMMKKDKDIREEYLTTKKLRKDPRITKNGKFLRKTSFDEFPQFINVIKGEMSIVGPRPYLFREINDMGDKYESIIKVKPGITGLWQASGRNELSFDERVILDQYYVRNWSLWFDIVIILKTISAVFKAKGVY